MRKKGEKIIAKAIDLTGQKFNHLTVIERDYDIQK